MVQKIEKPIFISDSILKIWETNKFTKSGMNKMKRLIKSKEIIVLDNETYKRMRDAEDAAEAETT